MLPSDERRYQVFISSTSRDLKDEREKAVQAILELHCFPSGMETFPSANDEQWEFIKREIDSSDYYIVILAGKYGSTAAEGISYTEKEYDYAVQTGKPVMSFLFHDLTKLLGEKLETKDAPRSKVEAFHRKAKAARLVKFYENADQLKGLVWQAITYAIQMRPGEGWVRGKNSRRLEDLEDLNSLRKQLAEAQDELRKLKAASLDRRSQLAQGNDPIEFQVGYQLLSAGPARPTGEVKFFLFRTTWDELFAQIYGSGASVATSDQIAQIFRGLCAMKAFESGAIDQGAKIQIEITDMKPIFDAFAMQFRGLGYVEFIRRSGGQTSWALTRTGELQIALLAGTRRPSNVALEPDAAGVCQRVSDADLE